MVLLAGKGSDNNGESDEENEDEEDPSVQTKASSTKYVPPALRKLQGKGDDEKLKLERLKKQLKGLLNRFVIFSMLISQEGTFMLK